MKPATPVLVPVRHGAYKSFIPKGRAILRILPVWWLVFAPVAGLVASGDEFYQRLLDRGMAHYNSGDYAQASSELRKAAFGFVEQVEKFETIEAYAAIAASRLGHEADARDALLRIVAAEKIQPHFRLIKLPANLRAEIEKTAVTLLTSEEARVLGVSERLLSAAAAAKPPVIVPTPSKTPNIAVTAPRQSSDANAAPPGTEPQPAAPKPQNPTPQPGAPAPQPETPSPLAAPPRSVEPQSVAPTPRPVPPTPQPVAQPKPATKQLPTPVPQPQPPVLQPAPVPPTPRPATTQPAVTATTSTSQPAQRNAEASLAEGQRAVDDGDIARARAIYSTLLRGPQLPHATGLRLAEGLYRVRDFEGAARAFQRAGAIGRGEERYHYYYAVALYETSHYGDAKRELAASLPFIDATTDVEHYRAKIEGAIE
jgi:hypothetical protein